MILHLFVDVKISRRGSVEPGQQFVHDNQQLHLSRLVNEHFLDRDFELFNLLHRSVFRLIKPACQHFPIDTVLAKFFRVAFASFFVLDVTVGRFIRSNNRTPVTKIRLRKQLVVFARLIDARRNQ